MTQVLPSPSMILRVSSTCGLVHVEQEHRRTLPREQGRGGAAIAPTGTDRARSRYQRHLASQTQHSRFPHPQCGGQTRTGDDRGEAGVPVLVRATDATQSAITATASIIPRRTPEKGRFLKATYRLLRFVLALGLLQPSADAVRGALIAAGVAGGSTAAFARSYSSGGYARPGGGSPSFSAPVRRPSTSGGGGYYRPPAMGSPGTSGFSGGDRAISRQQSGEAFRNYQSSRQPPAAAERRPSPWGADNGSAYAPPARRPPPAGWGTGPG